MNFFAIILVPHDDSQELHLKKITPNQDYDICVLDNQAFVPAPVLYLITDHP